jgi:hypothetical protein
MWRDRPGQDREESEMPSLLDCPRRFARRNTWPIRVLMYRFGVNDFRDIDARRRWWADYQVRAGQRSSESPRDQSTD